MKSFLIAITFALIAGLGVLALKEGKETVTLCWRGVIVGKVVS